jgi:hypothetical protein|tara:strand:+ start:403 stop:582 length:180 start_codon:yes stop_codon:yes gene_type:complete
MMTNEDVERLDAIAQGELVKQLNQEIASLKAKLKEKDDLLKQEIQYKIQEREKWQGKQT